MSIPNDQPISDSEERYRALFQAVDVGFCVLEMIFDEQKQPLDYRFLETNSAFEQHTGLVQARGRTAREMVPNLDDFWFRTYGDVALTGNAVRFENHAPAMSRWFDVYALRVGPAEKRQVGLLFTDITARKEDQEALRQSAERLRDAQIRLEAALSAGDIATWTFDLVNDRVGADSNLARLFSVDPQAASGGNLGIYLEAIHPEDRARVTETIQQSIKEQEHYEAEYRVVLPEGTHRWLVARGKVERDETGRAVALPGVVVDITARKSLEQERERLLEEQRTRAEREALLNQIGAAVRETLDPDAILQAAVSALGPGLRADRCYFVRYNQTRDKGLIFPEWFREEAGLGPIAGLSRQMSSYSVNRDSTFQSGRTQIVNDTVAFAPEQAAPLLALNVRALLRIPIAVGDMMTALGVAMSFAPRDWTDDEVRLVENVAILVRSALESASVQQRERNIARQLQEALVPTIPETVPGMLLSGFYRAALEESGVGGDFMEVAAIDAARTYLCVADLSGKGLAAAQQVALVKNTVRFALHTSPSVSDAITSVNRVLAEQKLLTGFATLFVGVYDRTRSTLTYVNCGQEPGLIWRAETGIVEQLPPTGPVLGGFESTGGYEEKTVLLVPGDILTLFTDGLTEVGPSRKELLEVEGVSEIFCQGCQEAHPRRNPRTIVEKLIAGVDTFARGSLRRDDIALLVGLVVADDAEV